jgi:hypothetical protein
MSSGYESLLSGIATRETERSLEAVRAGSSENDRPSAVEASRIFRCVGTIARPARGSHPVVRIEVPIAE